MFCSYVQIKNYSCAKYLATLFHWLELGNECDMNWFTDNVIFDSTLILAFVLSALFQAFSS